MGGNQFHEVNMREDEVVSNDENSTLCRAAVDMPIRMTSRKLLFASPGSIPLRLDIQNSPPAPARAASADIEFPQSFGDPSRRAEAVIVGEFLTFLNGLLSENVNTAILVENFTIGVAGVVDKAGVIPPDSGVDRGHFIHRKEKGMVAFHCLFIVALQFKIRPDPFADILDNARPFWDLDQREGSTPLDPRLANNEIAVVPFAVILHV